MSFDTSEKTSKRFVKRDDRLRVELLLMAAKTKGKFNTYNLAHDFRISRYFRGNFSKSPSTGLQVFEQMVRDSRLFENVYGRHELQGENYFLRETDGVFEFFKKIAADHGKNIDSKDLHHMKNWYQEILKSEEVEVVLPDRKNDWQFMSPQPIYTLAELHQQTRDIFLNPRTNRLFLICETGEWLQSPWIQNIIQKRRELGWRDLQCELIRIRKSDFAPLGTPLENSTPGEVIPLTKQPAGPPNPIELPWWEHNQHLTLAACDDEGSSLILLSGIYFRRQLNNPSISPVYLDSQNDKETLLKIFHRYRRKHFRTAIEVVPTREAGEINEVLEKAYQKQPDNRPLGERRENIRENLNKGQIYLKALYRNRPLPVGILSYIPNLKHIDFSVVGVLPEWQGHGVARILMEKMEMKVCNTGIELIELSTPEANVRFLEEQGYKRNGADSRHTGRVILNKQLSI